MLYQSTSKHFDWMIQVYRWRTVEEIKQLTPELQVTVQTIPFNTETPSSFLVASKGVHVWSLYSVPAATVREWAHRYFGQSAEVYVFPCGPRLEW